MGDVLREAYGVVQCKECAWFKNCVMPMRFTAEDLKRQMESQGGQAGQTGQMDSVTQNMLAGMATAAQNSLLEACPVFIDRLRSSARLAQKLKEVMQNWAKDDAPPAQDK